jgi:acyl carrier protein
MTVVADAVLAALARQLRTTAATITARADEGLDRLGLDSQGLMRVLLDVERALGLAAPLELPDEALDSPATLVAGIETAVAGRGQKAGGA